MKENYIEKMHKFAYFSWGAGTNTSGIKEDVKTHIHNTNTSFIQSWITREISTATKVKTFRRNIKHVRPYGCKILKVLKRITQNLPTFINWHLRKMFKIFWSNVICNEEMWGHVQ
jgi:hypothetical protein